MAGSEGQVIGSAACPVHPHSQQSNIAPIPSSPHYLTSPRSPRRPPATAFLHSYSRRPGSLTMPPTVAPQPHQLAQLLPKLHYDDPDFRYMALSDLKDMLEAHQTGPIVDLQLAAKIIEGLLKTLVDANGEVQNMAIKCLGPFANQIPESLFCPFIEKLSNVQAGNTVDQSIPSLALREVVISLPRAVPGGTRTKALQQAYSGISRVLIPRLIGYNVIPPKEKNLPSVPKGMLEMDVEAGTDNNAIDVLIEVARCFGPILQSSEVHALHMAATGILDSERATSMMKKKAVNAISVLSAFFSDQQLSDFVSRIVEALRDVHLTRSKRKLYITILGSMATSIPRKFGPYLQTLAPFVLSALSLEETEQDMDLSDDEGERDPEVDELLEVALTALDSFLSSCSEHMRWYTSETIEAATRLLKYDPNVAAGDDDDDAMESEEEDAADDDDEFEAESEYDDDDDSSWKVRRCAAKVLYTLISTRSNGDLLANGTLYNQVAPALINRFKEREESVRLEILNALSKLVRKSSDSPALRVGGLEERAPGVMGPPTTHKRRRGGSDVSMFDIQASSSLSLGYASPAPAQTPQVGPRASLASLSPDIIRGISQLLKNSSSSAATKQAAIALTKDIVITQQGGLDTYLSQLAAPVVESAKASSLDKASSTSASANSLRVEALQLIGAIADTHSSAAIQPFLPLIVPVLLSGIREKYGKVAIEGLTATEQVMKALTPPRATTSGLQNHQHLEALFDALAAKTTANDADMEVRVAAINVLGMFLGRTSGTQGIISPSKRAEGLDLLAGRLKNEMSRLASIRAVETVAALTKAKNELTADWVRSVALELCGQLRKSSRVLRGASLAALRTLVLNPFSRECLDEKTRVHIVEMLLPLLDTADLHLLGPALVILTTFTKDNAKAIVTHEVNVAICNVVRGTISGNALEALLAFVRAIGEQGAGNALMRALLKDVGIYGNPEVVGMVEGSLLVYGGQSVGVTVDDFKKELVATTDDTRKCLALAVLGEAALRLGSQSTIEPKLFMQCFSDQSETVPLAAAVALGRAGAGNVSRYLPEILSTMGKPSSPQYLLLHSIKEILQQEGTDAEIMPFAEPLWQNLVAASQAEDNKAIGAECIGRLAIIVPKTYLPQLQAFVGDGKASVRGMVISALRYTLADTDEAYDRYLQPIVVPMLVEMMKDADIENRRLALTTFNSAMHNKPHIILPALDQLLPLAMKETEIKPELIREVQMGPFKHKVDDGLELRKSAYETLYALLETAFSRLSPTELSDCYDRVVAGVNDEHDVRILCNLMLSKLIVLSPEQTRARLHSIAQGFRTVLSFKPKDSAVKQELEKLQEVNKGIVKVSIQLQKTLALDAGAADDAGMRAWSQYWEWATKENQDTLRLVQAEMREREH
ncbi:TIP120-domain-containing protein [Sporormia fimetaria CBS 119925]|uniref:TIP120-domain-containing protein n=1 Tax=Sporormia fimetaria CBS 119925 TaxID=1340428 RepID=A0A6A6UZ74_9PLEO|nr:TIP120-domain-containing protein [Sporormia fimetaria CBS 119925]